VDGGNVRWWLKGLAVGAVVGLGVGFFVGDTLGRVFMRLLFLALPVTLGLLLIAVSVVVAALPVPLLVERFAPDRRRDPGPAARRVLGIGAFAIAVYAASGIILAYSA
jgi:hypothetical protein